MFGGGRGVDAASVAAAAAAVAAAATAAHPSDEQEDDPCPMTPGVLLFGGSFLDSSGNEGYTSGDVHFLDLGSGVDGALAEDSAVNGKGEPPSSARSHRSFSGARSARGMR